MKCEGNIILWLVLGLSLGLSFSSHSQHALEALSPEGFRRIHNFTSEIAKIGVAIFMVLASVGLTLGLNFYS